MRKLLKIYHSHFPIIVTVGVLLIVTSTTKLIPYLNLAPEFFSTISLSILLFFLVKSMEDNLKVHSIVLLGLLGSSLLFELLTFSYISELIGNLFFIFLFYSAMVEAREK